MKTKGLLAKIEDFQNRLIEHKKLWGESLDDTIPDYPIRNHKKLEGQSRVLGRLLGELRPQLETFRDSWMMENKAAGVAWDALDAAVGLSDVAQIKGPSLTNVVQALDQIIGRLQAMNPETQIEAQEIPPTPKEKPLVFISYASDELDLADFVKNILLRVSDRKIEVFVAKQDISSGADPLKIMLNAKLKRADAIIPICSYESKKTPWLWWESASVWAIDGKVHPLFTDISANEFGPPLTLVAQGKEFFAKQEFFETIETLCKNLRVIPVQLDFTEQEAVKYAELNKSSSKPTFQAHVKIRYEILEQTQHYHKYSLVFEIQNKSTSAFDDVVLDLFFPTKYLIKKVWDYPHLKSSLPKDKPGYTCLTFAFNSMPEIARQQFSHFLLPEKTLTIFGIDEGKIAILEYEMDLIRWTDRSKYKVSYNLYINRRAPQKDSIEFSALQYF